MALPLSKLSTSSIQLLHQFVWWSHALLAFGFLIAIPLTKAFHLISSPLYMLVRDTQSPVGRLTVAAESGAGTIRDAPRGQEEQARQRQAIHRPAAA